MEQLSELQQQAAEYFARQNYAEAVVLYERIIQANPTVLSNYWHLGLALLLQGQEAEAQATWMSAWLQSEPEQIESQTTELIDILQAEAQRQESRSEFLSARIIRHYIREFCPNYINNLLAIVLLPVPVGGDYLSEKKLVLSQVTQLLSEENYNAVYPLIMKALNIIGAHDDVCVKFFEKCSQLKTFPKNNQQWLEIEEKFTESFYRNGILLMQQERLEEAIHNIKKAINLRPDFADLHFQLSLILSKQRRYEEAVNSLKRVIELDLYHQEAHQKLSQIELYFHRLQKKGYYFGGDLFTNNIPVWEKYLHHFAGKHINALEIGSFEGESACWLIDNVLTHQFARLTCIDLFNNEYSNQFNFNISKSGASEKITKIQGLSQEVLRKLPLNSFDIIYIDGSHLASDVLEDAVLSWRLLKTEGIIIFDDYELVYLNSFACSYHSGVMIGAYFKPSFNPKVGIDAFLSTFEPKIKILHKEYQVFIEKID
ncbi:MAG TPA: class I SAM-dependent methyltransferase [Chroococcales cyanobacterium]|jgi:tetratricopeptide (TPR) repeat protein